jgi:hypothetical protein
MEHCAYSWANMLHSSTMHYVRNDEMLWSDVTGAVQYIWSIVLYWRCNAQYGGALFKWCACYNVLHNGMISWISIL